MTNRRRPANRLTMQSVIWGLVLLFLLCSPISALSEEPATGDELIAEVKELLLQHHLSDVSEDELTDSAIRGMVQSLDDPYTDYMTHEEWDGYQNSIEQHYVGIGVRLGEDESGVYALEVFANSPADEAGLLKGDYIVSVNGVSTAGKTMNELVSLIAGVEDTTVAITVMRGGTSETFTMARRSINIPNVEHKWLEEGFGYVRIHNFSMDADEAFEQLMSKMRKQGVNGLVIDVRGNPGGYLGTVVNIAGQFIESGVLMHTRDKRDGDRPVTIRNGQSADFPVVLIVDRHSASGSEVLAGALQDYGLATIVGVQSFGKGSVQTIFPLSNGGVLKTTVQEYLTPDGRPVNGVGITPDIEVSGRVPQLLTAFREAGLTELAVRADQREIYINDVSFNELLPYVELDGRFYVHSRVLGAMNGLDVNWDGDKQQISLVSADEVYVFSISSPIILQDRGMTYIDLDEFADRVDGFAWSMQDGELTMSIRISD